MIWLLIAAASAAIALIAIRRAKASIRGNDTPRSTDSWSGAPVGSPEVNRRSGWSR